MIKEYKNFEIIEKKGKSNNLIWDLPFFSIKNRILGKDFTLSLNFIDKETAKKLNIQSRGKDYYPNVLTFPLDSNEEGKICSGEIYICKSVARTQYKSFDLSYRDFLKLLFIHGCLHLTGLSHDCDKDEENMVKLENEILSKFQ